MPLASRPPRKGGSLLHRTALYGLGGPKLVLDENEAPHFIIEAGKLNYIGDIYAGNVSPFDVDDETWP